MGFRLIRAVGLSLKIGCLAGLWSALALAEEAPVHWAFRPLAETRVPPVAEGQRVRNEIDAFVVQGLARDGLTPAPESEARALVRRVYFDLIGLPPSPEELRAFLEDASPEAYERLLERLLESPHFGERWGRHWLDNVGYVDVQGLDNDATIISTTENKWLYRDYVISAFNRDVPFDRFLLEQLAGDECVDWRNAEHYSPETQGLLVATGFLRNSADDTDAGELNRRDVHYQILERTQEVVANNLLGLTIQCAKCHDHKYEPISHVDYYRWQALFQPAFNPDQWLPPAKRQIPAISGTEKQQLDARNADIDRQISEIKNKIAQRRQPAEQRVLESKLAALPESIRADTLEAIRTPAEKRTEVQKYLAGKFAEQLKVKPEEASAILPPAELEAIAEFDKEIAGLTGKKEKHPHWQAVYDAGPPTPTRLLKRGNPLTPGEEVAPGMLAALAGGGAGAPDEFQIVPQFGSSGRRHALAKRLTDPNSPAGALVIRVRINRIWQVLFGKGIVDSTENFGVTGSAPTHPELLEWLGTAFVADGMKLKPFLKRIMTSATYRQSSIRDDEMCRQIDPENKRLWKQRLRRLESEAIRDAMLTVSGKLDRTPGGAPIPVDPRPDGSFVVKTQGLPTPTSQFRRTVYLLTRRNYHPTLLSVFDQPNLATNCSARSTSAVVLQSLTMLNDAFVLEQAEALAERVRTTTNSQEHWVRTAFELTLGREPSAEEAESCREALQREIDFHLHADPPCTAEEAAKRALTRLCHTLLNTSEFLAIP